MNPLKSISLAVLAVLAVMPMLILSPSGWAQPRVLSDRGGTELVFSRPLEPDWLRKTLRSQSRKAQAPNIPLGLTFPHTTERMAPGRVYAQSLNQAGHPPFVVVGHDPLSLSWIQRNQSLLTQTAAGALVVSVKNERQWRELKRLLAPIPLHPASGDTLSRDLNIDRYPFYVNGGEIAQ